MLLELGAAPQVAQAQMRHSDPRITLEVYSHVVGESQRSAVEKVAELLGPIGPEAECFRGVDSVTCDVGGMGSTPTRFRQVITLKRFEFL